MKRNSIIILFFTICVIFPRFSYSQNFDKLDLPPSNSSLTVGGTMAYDILNANGFIFIYSFDRVLVFRSDNNAPCGSIYFDEQVPPGGDQIEYGKFNPLIYNPRLYTGSINFMTYNTSGQLLYVVKPSLEIDIINVDHTLDYTFSNGDIISSYDPFDDDTNIPDLDMASFKPINGVNIIKFDNVNNRLYWVVRSHDADRCPIGNFHYRKRFLGLYNIDLAGDLVYQWHEVMTSEAPNYQESAISDIAFNSSSDYYYLIKLNKIEVRKFLDQSFEYEYFIDGDDYFEPPAGGGEPMYKFSKLLYVNESNLHLIIALPYRYPNSIPKENVEADIFTINGNHTDDLLNTGDFKNYPVPSQRITDGTFLSGASDLVLSYAPDLNEVTSTPSHDTDHDIAILSYDQSSNTFLPYLEMNTNNENLPISQYDINVSLCLTVTNSTNLLISKKDEIVKLSYNGSEYSFSQLIEAENNLFSKGVSHLGKAFICAPYSSGFEAILPVSGSSTSIRTGYPVYHITADNDGDKLYFYNKLNSYNSDLYICQIDEQTGSESITPFSVESCIGDCIFNPYKNHFLVSENGDFDTSPAKILVIDNNQNNTVLSSIILPPTVQYPRKMFIAPNNRLYVLANMVNGAPPKVLIYTADDLGNYAAYTHINSFDITAPTADDFVYFSGNFCYNPYNQKVYATIHPTEITLDPYSSVQNSMFDFETPTETSAGSIFSIDDDTGLLPFFGNISYTGKIICPKGTDNSQYFGKMFVIGKKLYVLDYINHSIVGNYDEPFNDIAYSPYHDQLWGLRDSKEDPLSNNSCDRTVRIFKINSNGNNTSISDPIAEIPGQASSLFYNPYDNKLYIHQKNDNHKLGGTQVRIIRFDPMDVANTTESIDLGLTSFYPELDHNPDFHYNFYNISTPYTNPYNNTIYIPNGGHSCVSKVPFVPDESLLLNNQEWAWLSVPRMDRIQNEVVGINDVFSNENLDAGNFIIGTTLKNLPLGEQDEIINVYQGTQWDPQGDLSEIQSTLGYKLKFEYATGYQPPDQKWLHLEGSVLDPDYANLGLAEAPKENWLGYYLYQEQSPFDAISDEDLEHIYSIKGQYWACGKFWGDGIPEPYWVCQCYKGKSVRLKYGDMAVIKTYQEIDFRWQLFGTPLTDNTDRLESENFTFTEQADYTPIFIELDSTVKPLEIGAFVEDVCVGATSVFPDDTLVLVPAYTKGISGEIYFEYYYGSNKMHTPPISEYYVKSNRHKQIEQRTIHTSDISDYFLVSLKKPEAKESPGKSTNAWIKCNPNPLKSGGTVSFYIPHDGYTEIKLYNIFGVEQMILYSGVSNMGTHQLSIDGKDANNNNLPNGTYILSLKSFKSMSQSKIIVLR